MTLWVAQHCGCKQDVGFSQKRAKVCDQHGNLFVKADADGKAKRPQQSREPQRDWSVARSKVEEEECCRICKRDSDEVKLEAAHILGREYDEPRTEGSKVLLVHPLRVIPACGPFPEGCHGDIDFKRINLVHHLTIEEQLQAVKDAGGIAPAFMALAPVSHREEVNASAARS